MRRTEPPWILRLVGGTANWSVLGLQMVMLLCQFLSPSLPPSFFSPFLFPPFLSPSSFLPYHVPVFSWICHLLRSSFYMIYCQASVVAWGKRMRVRVSPQLLCWNLFPSVMVFRGRFFGMWVGREGGTLMSRICALIEKDFRELPHPFRHVRI